MSSVRKNALAIFSKDQAGAVTTEFVIIFPVVIALIFFVVFISLLIASVSDVQQIAHELSRGSLRYSDPNMPHADICSQLAAELLPQLLEQSFFLDPSKLTVLPCPNQPEVSGRFTVSIQYSFLGDYVKSVGENLGIALGDVARSSATYW